MAPISIAVEGLPGVGKTTLIASVAHDLSAGALTVEVIPEIVSRTIRPDTAFFRRNDERKAARLRVSRADVILLDRYWVSTEAYVLATPGHAAMGAPVALPSPTAWLYLDRDPATAHPAGSDGQWAEPAFCEAHRQTSLHLLAERAEAVWLARSRKTGLVGEVRQRIDALLRQEVRV